MRFSYGLGVRRRRGRTERARPCCGEDFVKELEVRFGRSRAPKKPGPKPKEKVDETEESRLGLGRKTGDILMSEPTVIEWNGHKIEFSPILSRRTLWMATINELRVDGKLVATSGGFCFGSCAKASIEHKGKTTSLTVESSTCFRRAWDLNCRMIIDGNVVFEGLAKTFFRW